MALYTVNRAWKPTNGKTYGIVEVRMADDFQRDDPYVWGLVNARNLDQLVTFDLLRIVGAPSWHPRFDLRNVGADQDKWQTCLGGNGAWTALSGVHAQKSKLRIKRLEVFGVPGCGLLYEGCPSLKVDTGLMDRTGWPVYGGYQPGSQGAKICSLTSRDHWFGKAWGDASMKRGVSLRRFEPVGVGARGELTAVGEDYELINYTHQGDGISWKLAGTQFRVRGFHGGACFLNGIVPSNITTFPDPVAYKHLHEARGIWIEDSVFSGNPYADIQSRALVYVSFPFTEPPIFRRCTFIKGRHQFAFQINWAAPRFEECEFVGWADQAAAFELSPASEGMPAAAPTFANCRFWTS